MGEDNTNGKHICSREFTDDLECRNEYYNSKTGRMHDAEAADAATQGGPVRG